MKSGLTHFKNAAKGQVATFTRSCHDFYAGVIHPQAMSAENRHINTTKMIAGGLILAYGLTQLNAGAIAGGIIPAIEAEHEFEAAGHHWNVTHPTA